MFVIYIRTKFHIPPSNSPLVIAVRLRGKWKFRTTAMLLF